MGVKVDDLYGLLVIIEYVDDNVGDIVVEAEFVVPRREVVEFIIVVHVIPQSGNQRFDDHAHNAVYAV